MDGNIYERALSPQMGAFGAGTFAKASQKGQDLLAGICVSIDKLCEKCRIYKRV